MKLRGVMGRRGGAVTKRMERRGKARKVVGQMTETPSRKREVDQKVSMSVDLMLFFNVLALYQMDHQHCKCCCTNMYV